MSSRGYGSVREATEGSPEEQQELIDRLRGTVTEYGSGLVEKFEHVEAASYRSSYPPHPDYFPIEDPLIDALVAAFKGLAAFYEGLEVNDLLTELMRKFPTPYRGSHAERAYDVAYQLDEKMREPRFGTNQRYSLDRMDLGQIHLQARIISATLKRLVVILHNSKADTLAGDVRSVRELFGSLMHQESALVQQLSFRSFYRGEYR